MQIQLFDARMLAPLVRFLDHHGRRSEPFLDRARIPGEAVESGGWVAKKQAYDLAFDIVQRLRSPDAVFLAYSDFDVAILGPIAKAMKSCRTVKESLELGARLGSTAFEGSEYFLERDGDTTWFSYRESKVVSDGQTFINDMTLAVYYHVIRATIGEDWHPEQLRIRRTLITRHRTTETFHDCSASAHPASTGLAFPSEFLTRRLCWQPAAGGTALSHEWKFGPDDAEPVVEKLYRLLASQFPFRALPTLEQVSRMANTSPRTLKRHLQAAGMSYGRVIDRLRFDAACELLAEAHLSVKQIAYELGYSGTSNFTRSFRRMTGLTPGEYRRQPAVHEGRF